jgi:hypothetical protein
LHNEPFRMLLNQYVPEIKMRLEYNVN